MSVVFSSLTPTETFRMYGSLTRRQIEDLLGKDEALRELEGIDAHIDEAMCQYPAEDFLESIKTRLHELSKKLRGDNKDTLNGIIESLDDIAQCTFYAADYGRDELQKARNAIDASLHFR